MLITLFVIVAIIAVLAGFNFVVDDRWSSAFVTISSFLILVGLIVLRKQGLA